MDLSFCIVNTNCRDLLERCLDAIEHAELDGLTTEVLVLDNASTDGSAEMVLARSQQVELIALERRQGKAISDSQLLERAQGEFCLLLNEDSEIKPDAPLRLVEALRADPRAAAAGAQLLAPDGEPQPCAWRFTSVATAFFSALQLHRRLVVQSGGELNRRVDWAQSAALMVQREAVAAVGFFDHDFFVYGDEVDLAKRLYDTGWYSLYVPRAGAYHREGLSRGDSARRRIVQFHRGRDLYMKKHHTWAARYCVRALIALSYLERAVVALLLPRHSAKRYLWHVKAALMPWRGEGISEVARRFNAKRDVAA